MEYIMNKTVKIEAGGMKCGRAFKFIRMFVSQYSEYEKISAEFKRQASELHLKPEVEAALIARARRRAVSTPFSFYDLLLDEIQQLRNKGIV
jgi:hypothetical protein